MRVTFFISLLSIFVTAACVDRLSYDINKEVNFGISIDGYISDQPGPYEIKIQSIFDIESKESRRTPISVRSLIISDDKGNGETLTEIEQGLYQTSPTGIRGVRGGVYTVRAELFDGRIYESIPDTIVSTPGSIDSLYISFNETYDVVGEKQYSFDLLFDASFDEKINNHLLWKFTGTFQAETHPELNHGQCFWSYAIGKCNFVPPCSGYTNIGTNRAPVYQKTSDCTCCRCWYNLFNPSPVLSDDHLAAGERLTNVKARTIPLNQWTLEHKIRLEVSQMSLTRSTFRFWKAIRDQEKAIGNLFQPVSGKIPANFIQVSGTSIPIAGLFFATAINSKAKYLERFHLPPNLVYAISLDSPMFADDCRLLFPNSTARKPSFWQD